MFKLWLFTAAICTAVMTFAQQNQIDFINPLAPEFAQFGKLDIGVRTIEVSSPDAVDVLSTCLLYTSPSPRDVEESRFAACA